MGEASPSEVAASLYRPLDRSKDEIRLLRILPSKEDRQDGELLQATSDLVQCTLEYDSLGSMRAKKQFEQMMEDGMLKMMGLELNDTDEPDVRHSKERQRQWYKTMMAEEINQENDAEPFILGSTRQTVLQRVYDESRERLIDWLPSYFQVIATETTFDQWLRSWIWRPLNGHEKFADKPTPGYFALSYVCEDPPFPQHDTDLKRAMKLVEAGGSGIKDFTERPSNPKKQIMVNGQIVEITQNAEKALRTLREMPEIQNGQRVWVDCLSIHQEDLVEKAEEVKRMDVIYGNADRVISWLGDDEDHSGDVLDIMEALGEVVTTERASNLMAHWFRSDLDNAFFHYAAKLFSRPYWSRIWIQQELALAQPASIMICGMRRYSAMNVLLFGKRHTQATVEWSVPIRSFPVGRESYESPVMSYGTFIDGIAKMKNMYELRFLIARNKPQNFVFNTLWFRTAAENHATDPRDLLYGMMAILPSGLVANLRVDYGPSNPYRQVMVDFAAAHIKTYNTLWWILFRPWYSFYNSADWPSWVCNLGLPVSSAHYWWCCQITQPFQASKGLEGDDLPLAEVLGTRLRCRGFQLDVVRQATKPSKEEEPPTEDFWALLPRVLKDLANGPHADLTALHNVMSPKPDLAQVLDQLLRKKEAESKKAADGSKSSSAPIGDQYDTSRNSHHYGDQDGLKEAILECLGQCQIRFSPSNNKSMFDTPYDDLAKRELDHQFGSPELSDYGLFCLQEFLGCVEQLDLWSTPLRSLFAPPNQTPADSETALRVQATDRTVLLARFFTTSEKGYLGAALGDIKAGDQIFVLAGCPMPVALRPKGDAGCFELLGGVFMPGAMEGEAVVEFLEGGGKASEVILC